jgi:ABC-type amino acid transport substrate-binding protein
VTAVQAALVSMINDGTYLQILTKYGDQSGAITADVAGQLNKVQ